MKNRSIFEKVGDFVLGKGFYIVLALCVAAIGASGYYLVSRVGTGTGLTEPVGGGASVVLPDSEANGPDPAGGLPTVKAPEAKPPVKKPDPKEGKTSDDPEPVKRPTPQEGKKPAQVVYTWPVKGEILRDFSVETLALDPTMGDWRTHGGLDVAAELGINVLAMAPGTVAEVYEDGLMGTTVVIAHGEGLTSTYCGLAPRPTVEPGAAVETGTIIGAVGGTAIAESGLVTHLHLETCLNGEPVDPMEYLPEK